MADSSMTGSEDGSLMTLAGKLDASARMITIREANNESPRDGKAKGHVHGKDCTCREKLFKAKRELREKHIERRRTLKANGIVIPYE